MRNIVLTVGSLQGLGQMPIKTDLEANADRDTISHHSLSPLPHRSGSGIYGSTLPSLQETRYAAEVMRFIRVFLLIQVTDITLHQVTTTVQARRPQLPYTLTIPINRRVISLVPHHIHPQSQVSEVHTV